MKTIKLELSVKLLLGAIALGLFLNAFKDFPPKANASLSESKVDKMFEDIEWFHLASNYIFAEAAGSIARNKVLNSCYIDESIFSSSLSGNPSYEFRCN